MIKTVRRKQRSGSLKTSLGSMKLGNSVDIRLEATELPKIEPYAVVELEEPVYAPYVQRGNFPVLVEKITCKGIRPVANEKYVGGQSSCPRSDVPNGRLRAGQWQRHCR